MTDHGSQTNGSTDRGLTRRGLFNRLSGLAAAPAVSPLLLPHLADAGELVRRAMADGLRPEPELTIDEWADKYRWLDSKSSAEEGRYRTSRTPYMREIMRELSPSSRAQIVVFRSPRQMGKTEGGSINLIGYTIHQTPCPIVLAMPGKSLLKRNKRTRIDPMLTSIPELANLVSLGRTRDGSNGVFEMNYPGGVLVCLTYNSAADLRSTPYRVGIFDEVEGAPLDVDKEGSPLKILEKGANTYGTRKKLYFTSSPKWKRGSIIDALYEETDQRKFHVPCPDCGGRQELVFEHLRWPKGKPDQAEYVCVECGVLIPEHYKTQMLESGIWVATAPDLWNGTRAGFSIEGLASPLGWLRWRDIAREFEEAGTVPDKLQAFWNTTIGRSHEAAGEIADWKRLYDRRETYDIGMVPLGGMVLFAGCDVQADRIEGEVVAFGRGLESWSVEQFTLSGRTTEPEVWKLLDAKLATMYPSAYGVDLPITLMAVDARYNTSHVYNFIRKHPGKAIAVRGTDDSLVPIGQPKAVDVTPAGKRKRRGLQVWPVANAHFKSQIYGWLALEKPTAESGTPYPAGYMHFPQYGEEWFQQLCAEHVKTQKNGTQKWEKWRDRNEALDCRVYARAAAVKHGIDQFGDAHWDAIEARLAPEERRIVEDKPERGGDREGFGVKSRYF